MSKLRGAFPRAGDDGGSHLPLHHLQKGARLNQSNLAVILKHDLIAGMAFQLGEDMKASEEIDRLRHLPDRRGEESQG